MPEAPLSIAILTASLSRRAGGVLPVMQEHAAELAKLGVQVGALGVADDALDEDRAQWNDVALHALPPLFRAAAFAPNLDAALRRMNPDLVHQHGLWLYPSRVALRWGKRTRRPVVVSTHGMLDPWAARNGAAKKRVAGALFEYANLRAAACIHCFASEVAQVRALAPRTPLATLPNGVRPASAAPPPRPGWMNGRTLLFLGRLHPKKGLTETIRAFAMLRDFAPDVATDWRLAIAGWDDGGHAADLARLIATLGAEDRIYVIGPLFGADKDAALAHADAFILASRSEGLPMAVLEAWAQGLPTFITAACNLPEGFAADAAIEIADDPNALAATLARQLARPDLADVGERARHLAAERFSWAGVARDLLAVYRWLARGAARPEFIDVP